jgi:2-succinyl-6-hydroxy-2,4-cyclohexadiene-1-carboxylate synthase
VAVWSIPGRSRRSRSIGVVALHRVVVGSGPRVVLLHGFTQTHASWHRVVDRLGADHEVVAIDAPGHGGSSDIRADLATGARLIAEAGGRATYVGYSMGGRVALRLALDHPDHVQGLVLIGATAGIRDSAEREQRRLADEATAARIERDGVGPFLTSWLAQPMFAGLPDDPVDHAARAENTAAGLASSLRLAGTATMDPPWWPELGAITAPTAVVVGELDTKFTAEGHRLVAAIGPGTRLHLVAGARHAAHLHDPDTVADVIRSMVERAAT